MRLALSSLLLVATACRATVPAAATSGSAPSDAQVGAIVLAANDADISYAQLALARSGSAEVKAFAEHVLHDHTAVNEQARALFARLGVAPQDHVISLDLRDDAEAKRDILRELEGRAFDSTYVVNEVRYHTKVLGAIDQVLIPAARDSALRALLVAVRPAVQMHLTHATQLSRTLKINP